MKQLLSMNYLKKLGITMKNSKRESGSIPAFSTIKNYWETRTPGIKPRLKPGTLEFLDELEYKRYNKHYAYLTESRI